MYMDDLEGRTRVSGGFEEENVNFDPSKAHVDPKALPTIMDVVRRLQESEGLLIGQTAPFDKVCSSYLYVPISFQIWRPTHRNPS